MTIGVDTDLYPAVMPDSWPALRVTSMLKRVDDAVYNTIAVEVNGTFAFASAEVTTSTSRVSAMANSATHHATFRP